MAQYLKDQFVTNVTLNEDSINQISAVFAYRKKIIDEKTQKDDLQKNPVFFTYIIRFDNKGYRIFTLDELLNHFRLAKNVERVIFTVETGVSIQSNHQIGTSMELRLDARDHGNCFFVASSDDGDWVDASFSSVQEVLAKCKNKNKWARTVWTQLGVQILGLALGFVLSLWAAIKISPKLTIEKSFVISFLFAFLIFSNTWTFINEKIRAFINFCFPNVKFYRFKKDYMHWLLQAIVGWIVIAIMLYILSLVFSYIGSILGGFIKK